MPIQRILQVMLVFLLANAAAAQSAYPDKPVRLVVPFSAGGGTDIQARVLAAKLRQNTDQLFLVDNRAGAGGLIGSEFVVEAPADGYAVLFTTASIAVNATLMREQMKFNALTDLAPVTWVSSAPLVLVVHPAVPAKSVAGLAALARRTRQEFNAGGNTPGSVSHYSVEWFKHFAGVRAETTLFKGGGPAVLAAVGGEIDLLFAVAPVAIPYIRAGRLRALAVTGARQIPALPDVPAMHSVYPGFVSDNWYAMFMPAGAPGAAIARLHAEVGRALRSAEMLEFCATRGVEPVGSTPEALADMVRRDIAGYAEVIRRGQVRMR